MNGWVNEWVSCSVYVGGHHDKDGMDCTDIVIGAAVGQLSRVGDYYTPDRSTPRLDEFYGGSQSLTAAIARQDGDTTTVIFRRPINGLSRLVAWAVVESIWVALHPKSRRHPEPSWESLQRPQTSCPLDMAILV